MSINDSDKFSNKSDQKHSTPPASQRLANRSAGNVVNFNSSAERIRHNQTAKSIIARASKLDW